MKNRLQSDDVSSTKRLPREESGLADLELPVPGPSAVTPVVVVDDDLGPASVASPARALQDALTAEFADVAPPARRWSKRATLMFIIGTCGAFWVAVGWGISLLER